MRWGLSEEGAVEMAQQERSIATREAILNAAGEVFSLMPFAQAKVSDVLARLDVGKGALYFHFKTKHELALAVLVEGRERLRQAAAIEIEETGSGTALILALADTLARLITGSPVVSGAVRLIMQSGHEFPGAGIDPGSFWKPVVQQMLSRAQQNGEVRSDIALSELAWLATSAFLGTKEILSYRGEMSEFPERVVQSLRALLLLASP